MKKTAKKLLALLLAAVMMIPTMAVSTSAEEKALISEMNLDFTDYEVSYNSATHTMSSKYLSAVKGSEGSQSLSVQTETDNSFLRFSGNKSEKSILKFFGTEGGLYTDNYQLTFSFRLGGDTHTHYLGIDIRSDSTSNSKSLPYYNYGAASGNKLVAFGNNNASKLNNGEWYTVTMIRSTTQVHGSLSKADGTYICGGNMAVAASAQGNGPAIRFMIGESNAAGTYTVDIDNIAWKATDTATSKNVVAEDFDSLTTGAKALSINSALPASIGNLANYSESTTNYTSAIVNENGNKYLEMHPNGANGLWVYPTNFAPSQNWTMTFDFKLKGSVGATSGNYLGIYPASHNVKTEADTREAYWRTSGWTGLDGNAKITGFTADTWYTFKVIRNGNSWCWMIWETAAGDYNSAAADKRSVTWASITTAKDKNSVPALRLMGGSTTDGVIAFDNMVFENTINTATVVGAQSSNTVSQNGTYAVRFVATINDFKVTDTIKLQIKASYTNPTTNQPESKTFTYTATEAYDYIIGNDHGITEVYSAAELGGEKLIALGIHDIPTGVGTVKFEITTIGAKAWGANTSPRTIAYTADTANPNVVDCYSIIDGNTVKLVNELA